MPSDFAAGIKPELKSCPFCGGEAEYEEGVNAYAGCCNCGLHFSAYPVDDIARAKVVTRWNTRAALTPPLPLVGE